LVENRGGTTSIPCIGNPTCPAPNGFLHASCHCRCTCA
jgi:hypothetical protein